ncbi:MAG: hypothetical protein OEL89_01610 [Candidatus Peregrinibacteria bacterium]|nr:hypothetical protein [Candidatus Peregrinibacteria bacterium]
MSIFKLTYTGVTASQKNFTPHNQNNGCDVYVKNDDANVFLYMQHRDDGTCVVDSLSGFTFVTSLYKNNKVILNTENRFDFTDGGANTLVPIALNNWRHGDITGLENTQLFFKETKDSENNVIGVNEVLIYFEPIIGLELDKTIKFIENI